MANSTCFQNGYAQLIHRYADIVLLLFIAAISWWLLGLDRRVEINAEKMHKGLSEAAGLVSTVQERHNAVLKGLEQIDKRFDQVDSRLSVIDNRIYVLFGTKARGDGIP